MERANSLEGTLRVRSGGFHFDGSVYSSWFHNFIYGDLTGRTCDDEGLCTSDPDGEAARTHLSPAGRSFPRLEGQAFYLLLKGPGGGGLRAKMLGDYTRATLDNGSNVPRIPPWRIGGGLNWESAPLDAGFTLIYAGRQDKPGVFDTDTPSYVSLNAQIAWRPFRSIPASSWHWSGRIRRTRCSAMPSAFNKEDVLMPGRNIRLVLKVANF